MTALRQTYERYWRDRLRQRAGDGPNEILESIRPLLRGGRRLLDVGCGDGMVMQEAGTHYEQVHGCDVARRPLHQAMRSGMRTACADLNGRLPYKDGAFDCVTCLEVIEHVLNPLQLLRELRRVIRAEGTLILTTPNIRYVRHLMTLLVQGRFPHTTPDTFVWGGGHLHYFTRRDLAALLHDAGFQRCEFAINQEQFHRSWKRRAMVGLLGSHLFGEWICGGITAAAVRA